MNGNQSEKQEQLYQYIKNKIDDSRATLERVRQIVELLKSEDPENEESLTIAQNSEKLVADLMERIERYEDYKDKPINRVVITKLDTSAHQLKGHAYPAVLQGFLFYQKKDTIKSDEPQ